MVMKINSIAIKLSTSLNHPYKKKKPQFANPVTQFKAVSKLKNKTKQQMNNQQTTTKKTPTNHIFYFMETWHPLGQAAY